MQITKFSLGTLGVALYCYDHQNKIKHYLLNQSVAKVPHYTEFPPTFEVPIKEEFEKAFDKDIAAIENEVSQYEKETLGPDTAYRGKTVKVNAGEQAPQGPGCLYENKGSVYTGNFNKGVLEGSAKVVTPIGKFVRVEKCLYENGEKKYSVVYHEDGVRCEGTSDCFSCVRPDGSLYCEKVDQEKKLVRSFLYDSDFKLKSERTLTYPERLGQGIYYYEDGKEYIGEMNKTGPHGQGIVKDKYGDVFFEGEVNDGEFPAWNVRLARSLFSLVCIVGSFFV